MWKNSDKCCCLYIISARYWYWFLYLKLMYLFVFIYLFGIYVLSSGYVQHCLDYNGTRQNAERGGSAGRIAIGQF